MNAAMVWDSVDQQILLYGGLGVNNHYLGDLWSYSPGTGVWTAISCSGSAPEDEIHECSLDWKPDAIARRSQCQRSSLRFLVIYIR